MSEENVGAPADIDTTEIEASTPATGEESLGDAGKKALDAMKEQIKSLKDELAALDPNRPGADVRNKKAQAELEELRAFKAKAEGREAEYQAEQEKQRLKDEALAVANNRILSAELRAAAKGKLADPADAHLFINLSDFEVSDTGDVDTDALNAAIDGLIARKPHLAAAAPSRFGGDADAGPKGDPAKSGQITSREELKRMTPEEVVEAEAAGRLNALLKRG